MDKEQNNKSKPSSDKKTSDNDVVFYRTDKKNSEKKPVSSSGKRSAVKPGKLTKKRVILNIVISVLGTLLILGGCVCIVAYTYFHRINYQEISVDNTGDQQQSSTFIHPDSSQASETSEINPYTGNLLNDPMVLNIMLFGADTRANADTGNSDTMVLFSIDTRHKKLKMLSFMRDTYVDIPGHGENRINAAYTLGGAALTVSTIQKNYGIKIDRYAVVDFGSFKKIIDILGGIDVPLTSEEVDYINWQSWINDQDEYSNAESDYKESIRANLRDVWFATVSEEDKPINKNTLNFTAAEEGDDPTAVVHLNGTQALWYARNRGEDGICSGDDFTRTKRQRNVINIIINQLKSADIPTLLSVIYEIGPLITTNVKTSEITDLAGDLPAYLKYDIVSESAPRVNGIGTTFYFSDENHPIYINGAFSSVILISDWNNFRRQVAEFLYEELVVAPENSEDSLSIVSE